MTRTLSQLSIALLLLLAAALLFTKKHRSLSGAYHSQALSQGAANHQLPRTKSANPAGGDNRKATKSTNKRITSHDVAMAEREALLALGLGPNHPEVLAIDRVIARLSATGRDKDVPSQDLSRLERERLGLVMKRESLKRSGLGDRHPTILTLDDRLAGLERDLGRL